VLLVSTVVSTVSLSAYADSPAQAAPMTTAQAAVTASGQTPWISPDAQPVHQKTRAEVYHELIEAENNGQLAYLNSTLYAH
jgi:Domain of unknown function (DUF4148)